ncbi:uncharacterized protein BP01DRAFT_425425 [Aspergillus saccharolyticus JOP 1030-1]|uniref:USP domain-containing protein n=1 Tax=Aspergillus saccharolyticus JOP 1030-1 TaxID=1450539 RepID=A0A318Z5J0_9EURO|nr:hypothetical protein BP01DRAFT_425425 [Aspergillus saccharolyticus JOP 1030-1]PYH42581.1 hypothetical protein BP01DRAFT_425425 [Aspergillus saccharolyticus JOP 1030-1]
MSRWLSASFTEDLSRGSHDYLRIEETLTFPAKMIQYELYAFVNHLGTSIEQGHYVCYTQSPYGDWGEFNDAKFSAKTLAGLQSHEQNRKDVYILAYRRIQPVPSRSRSPAKSQGREEGISIAQPSHGVTLNELIKLKGRAVQWTLEQELAPLGKSQALIQVKSARARAQRAEVRIKLTSTNGEALEGRGFVSLHPNIIPGQLTSSVCRAGEAGGREHHLNDSNELPSIPRIPEIVLRTINPMASPNCKGRTNTFSPVQFVDQVASVLSSQKTDSGRNDHLRQQQQQYPAFGRGQPRDFSATQVASLKPLLLALHCLFPHELLLALDILDRGLVRRLSSSYDVTGSFTYAVDLTAQAPSPDTTEDIFLVHSASVVLEQSSSRAHTSDAEIEIKAYEVRLQAWSCTCPIFTLASFRGPSIPSVSRPEMTALSTAATTAAAATESSPRPEFLMSHGMYPFGGMLTRGPARSSPPVCKHLLASWLAARCPNLFNQGNDAVVGASTEELAGRYAGWSG